MFAHPLSIEDVSVIDLTRLRARTRRITVYHIDDEIETRTQIRVEQIRNFPGTRRVDVRRAADIARVLDALTLSHPFPSPGSIEYRWLIDFVDGHGKRIETVAFASHTDSCLVGSSTTARFRTDDFQSYLVAHFALTTNRP